MMLNIFVCCWDLIKIKLCMPEFVVKFGVHKVVLIFGPPIYKSWIRSWSMNNDLLGASAKSVIWFSVQSNGSIVIC